MSKPIKRVSIMAPIGITIGALIDFTACIREPRDMVIVMLEVALIALAIAHWVLYFQGYVDQQIEKRIEALGRSN
jgi:hypothetical protein